MEKMTSNVKPKAKQPRKYKKKEKKQDPVITTSYDQEDDESNDCEEEEEENKGKVKKRKNERKKILYELHYTHNACDHPVKYKSKTVEIIKLILEKNHNISYT
jgi:hypothetical protein